MFKNLKKFKNRIALFDLNKEYFYNDFLIKKNFLKRKIRKKNIILIICENKIEILFYYITFQLLRSLIVLIDYKTSNDEINKIIKKYKPNLLLTSSTRIKLLNLKYKEKVDVQNEFCIFRLNSDFILNINKKISILIPTSGSMGSSKFVMLSYENLIDNLKKISNYLNINQKHKTICNMPISYSYMISVIHSHIYSGASIFMTNKSIISRDFWKEFKQYNICSFNAVPYAYEIINKLKIKNLFNSHVKYLTQAGGHLNKEIKMNFINNCMKKKIKFYCMYGLTEASPRISYLNPKFLSTKIDSIGKPLRGYKIKIYDNSNQLIKKPNKVGKLFLRGKNIFLGYANSKKDFTKKIKLKLELETGDLGYKDNEGFYYLTARKKRIAKIFGYRIDLSFLEKKMLENGYIIYCKEAKEKLKISFNRKYDKNDLIYSLTKFTNIDQSGFKLNFMKKLPLNKNYKIDRTKV